MIFLQTDRDRRHRTTSLRSGKTRFRLNFEPLEERTQPATFVVNVLADSGAGSLRDALDQANMNPGPDRIEFAVTGTIQLMSALPDVTDTVNIDGTTAPGFAGTPLVEVNYNGSAGLTFAAGSEGSALRSLAHTNASTAGVTLSDDNILLVGNYIGLELDGDTVAGNAGGLQVNSSYNTIGIVGQPRNVISGNVGNGVTIDGAMGTDGAANLFVENYIGTDATGLLDRGNTNFGMYLTNGALFNNIGTTANKDKADPTLSPGNLISGNGSDGVRLDGGADETTRANNNFFSSNFIGTDVTGVAPLPNGGNGMSIIGANFTNVLGTQFGDDPFQLPFRYKNVISGNDGHGMYLFDAIGTKIQANFLGLGADNFTGVGNGLDGILIEGKSLDTIFGGPIPLGNVSAANGRHGVQVAGEASDTLIFNVFAGTAAFQPTAVVGNGVDGIHISSSGLGNVIRTSQSSGNGNNGIKISGNARNVIIEKVLVGLQTNGGTAQPNGGNGIEIGGNAKDILIGGEAASVLIETTISGNGGYGIALLDNASNVTVTRSFIGTDKTGEIAIGNGKGGVFIGGNATAITIGDTASVSALRSVISGNAGPGVTIDGASGNTIIGNFIGLSFAGMNPLANTGNGILITGGATNNLIGDVSGNAGNNIASNTKNGVAVVSGSGNAIRKNAIHDNAELGINLSAGANNDQAAPTLNVALTTGTGIIIKGTVSGTPNATYTVDLFANTAADPSGAGEGEFYLGSVQVTTGADGNGNFAFTGPLPPNGALVISATATDPDNNTSEFSSTITLSPFTPPNIVVGQGSGGNAEVRLFDATGMQVGGVITPFPGFTGDVRVAIGDVNGDGVPDIAIGTGPGRTTLVLVLSGVDGSELFRIQPFESAFTGGVFIALGDVNGDGLADLAITPDVGGGPRVRIFSGDGFGQLNDFLAIEDSNFRGGARLAFGDINGDGIADLLVAAGFGGGPRVAIFNGVSVASGVNTPEKVVADFFVFDDTLRNGVFIASGELSGDKFFDVIVGGGPGGGPRVFALDGKALAQTGTKVQLANFITGDAASRGGIRVAAQDVNGDGLDNIITGAGSGEGSTVTTYESENLPTDGLPNTFGTFDAFGANFTGGVFVG